MECFDVVCTIQLEIPNVRQQHCSVWNGSNIKGEHTHIMHIYIYIYLAVAEHLSLWLSEVNSAWLLYWLYLSKCLMFIFYLYDLHISMHGLGSIGTIHLGFEHPL